MMFQRSMLYTDMRSIVLFVFFFSSRRRHTRYWRDWSSDVCSSDLVDQLSSFADEVTRVAREVGTEGVLGGQADVKGVSGTWRDLTESVNGMASNLTDQVRQIANEIGRAHV